MPVLQSLAQAREKWSENAAGAIWDAAITKIILGGASNSRDLQDLTTLIGERDEITDSTTSATTAPAPRNVPSAGCRSCRPTPIRDPGTRSAPTADP
jgi:type IV secretory pathway TraG/TraD family ATPase VirD4